MSILCGGLTTAFGYYNPVVLPSMIMLTVGCGLITTLGQGSGTREWLGYQVLAGLGLVSKVIENSTQPSSNSDMQ